VQGPAVCPTCGKLEAEHEPLSEQQLGWAMKCPVCSLPARAHTRLGIGLVDIVYVCPNRHAGTSMPGDRWVQVPAQPRM
jgi:hypothetical protein